MKVYLYFASLLLLAVGAGTFVLSWRIATTPAPSILPHAAEPGPDPATGEASSNLERLSDLDTAAFSEIGARPPFSRSRRRPEVRSAPERVATARPQRQIAAFDGELKGIVIDNDRRIAVLRSAGDPTLRFLARGDEIDGWRLELINEDHVVLRNGAARADLPLRPD